MAIVPQGIVAAFEFSQLSPCKEGTVVGLAVRFERARLGLIVERDGNAVGVTVGVSAFAMSQTESSTSRTNINCNTPLFR